MNIVTIDTETDVYNNGNVFDNRNQLCAIGVKQNDSATNTYQTISPDIQGYINKADLLVGFNFKFDYHWLRKSGYSLMRKRIWDCQSAHYILTCQRDIFPSLDSVCDHYGIAGKLDIIKRDYWSRGITTRDIPWDVLEPYLVRDIDATYEVFQRQWKEATPAQRALILLDGDDLHMLQEMEWNGLIYDETLCQQRAHETAEQISKLRSELAAIYPEVPINFNSGDHLSAFLYGGTITEIRKVPDGFFKTGIKAGQIKYKNLEVLHTLPALYKPVRGSELKKDGYYATNEPTLRKLTGNKRIVQLLLELARLDKINGTYYLGIPEVNREMNWAPGVLHSNFNTTQTKTGRLSSNKPNQQNLSGDILDIFITRT